MNVGDNTQALALTESGNAPDEREWRMSKDGQPFDVQADRWQLSSRRSVNVSEIRQSIPAGLREGAIRVLAQNAETLSTGTVIGRTKSLRAFFQFAGLRIGTDSVSAETVVNYRHFCFVRDGHDAEVSGQIRPFLKKWFALGYPGVNRALVDELKAWRLKGREMGAAVNTLDPNGGPLMPDELASLQLLALSAFEQGDLALEDFSLLRLMVATGRRPMQVAQVKLGDMDDSKFEDPEPGREAHRMLLLKVPRLKAKGGHWRTRFRAVALTADLWNLLVIQRRAVSKRFDELLGRHKFTAEREDLQDLRDSLPLFPMWSTVEKTMGALSDGGVSSNNETEISLLQRTATSDAWHFQSQGIDDMFNRIASVVHATNRIGTRLKVFPRRLRYTYEFRLEQAGCPPAVIAWNMDHSDTRSLVSYSKNGPDKARAISKAMALGLAPFVKVFQGLVIASEESAEGGYDSAASRIFVEGTAGATCATLRGCGMNALPRPCYAGCPHFRPWLDGPHEQFLETILQERQRDLDAGVSDKVIKANDQLIFGIAQVLFLCEQPQNRGAGKAPTSAQRVRRKGRDK